MKLKKAIIGITSTICTFSMLAVAPANSYAEELENELIEQEVQIIAPNITQYTCYPAIQCGKPGTTYTRQIADMTNVYLMNGALIGLSGFLGGNLVAAGSFIAGTYYSVASAYWKPMSMIITYSSGTPGGVSKVVMYSQKNFKGKSQTKYR